MVVTSTSFVPEEQPAQPVAEPAAPSLQAHTPEELLDTVVAENAAAFGGQLGVATVGEHGPVAAGFSAPSPAWSTIKVPIAVAATRAQLDAEADVRAAITASDNDAAQRLYSAVGPEAVDAVLTDAGVPTRVNTAALRPEFSTFGQTQLSVADEAVLANNLACSVGGGAVLQLMGQVDPSQSYGLGAVGAMFKGGWGPDTVGSYHVRQFGLVPRGDGGWSPVALTALPADGTYDTGQNMLTAAAQRLAASTAQLPAAACQP